MPATAYVKIANSDLLRRRRASDTSIIRTATVMPVEALKPLCVAPLELVGGPRPAVHLLARTLAELPAHGRRVGGNGQPHCICSRRTAAIYSRAVETDRLARSR